MAYLSSLRSRRSLVWEIRDISKYQKDSPVFSLLNSNWTLQFNPVYETGKVCATSYCIKLKNCSGIESFEPFDVVTFLEDRRNNLQVHCSKISVMCSNETLFKDSFRNTCEKLPSVMIYDDVAIVCTFYPSTGLSLGTQTIRGSSLRIKHSIVWKTRKPNIYQKREDSPSFNLNNSKWKLEVHSIYNTQDNTTVYQICLRNFSGIQSLQPFEIETYLFDRRNFEENIWCSRLTVSSTSEILLKERSDTIYEKLPGLKNFDDITIVCTFGVPIGITLTDKMENDISVSMECSQHLYQRKHSFSQSDIAQGSSNASAPAKYFPDFENLSKDFGFLLDNSFMSDIQLECEGFGIAAHKAVLAARSPAFLKLLKHEMGESSNVTFEIKDIEPSVLREFLRYLYCGVISFDLSEEMLCKLYTASNNYSVRALKKLCSYYMTENLSSDNFIKYLILANEHNDLELLVSIARFITERPKLLTTDIWIKFSDEFPRLANEIYRTHMVSVLKNKYSEEKLS